MDKQGTNSIADKLGELDTLPAGYEPNLDSKWALLEASLEGQRKNRPGVYFWLRAAAVLLLGSFLTFLFLKEARPDPVVQEKPAPLLLKQNLPVQQAALLPTEARQTPRGRNVSNTPVSQIKKEVAVVHEKLPVEPEPVYDSLGADPEPLQTLASENSPPKKKKARYVQMDFGEPIQETNAPPIFYSSYPRLKVFGSEAGPPQNNSQANSRTAIIRINF